MRLILSVLTGALVAAAPPTLEAQKKTEKPSAKEKSTDRDGCVTRDGSTRCVFRGVDFDSVLTKRPAIGIQLSPTGTKRDTLGVFVSRVTPNGPAEKAGIIEGDRLVSINGVDLRVNAADVEDGYASELPTRRLTREVGKLNPGNVANLRVWSGGRVRDVAVTVGRASELRDVGSFGLLGGYSDAARWTPRFDGMRVPLREMRMLPRMKLEEMRVPRMRFEQSFPKMQLERLFDGNRWILTPGGDYFFERKLAPKEKEKLEKEKTEKEKAKEKPSKQV